MIVCLAGPESTGKSTMSGILAKRLGAHLVPECARAWLTEREGIYQESDFLTIAKLQWQQEEAAILTGDPVVLDTDLLNIRLWSEIRYGRCHPWILQQSQKVQNKLYLLMADDIPWVADSIRKDPDREAVLAAWQRLLPEMNADHVLITGAGDERLNKALQAIQKHQENTRMTGSPKAHK